MSAEDRQNKVFISHSSDDAEYVKAIVDLLEDIGLEQNEIICTSVDIYKIPLGRNIYDYLAEQFQNYNLHVLFILSGNYYASAACLNEMGAAWVLKHRYDAILLPGMEFEDVKGCIDKNQIGMKLDSEEGELKRRLNELQKNIAEEFSKPDMDRDKWERKRGEFLNKVKSLMAEEPAKKGGDAPSTGSKEPEETISLMAAILLACAADNNGEIFVLRDLGGTHVQAGIWDLTGNKASARTVAQWEGAVEELIHRDLIKRTGVRDRIYRVTHRGYEMADTVKEKLEFDESKTPDVYMKMSAKWQ